MCENSGLLRLAWRSLCLATIMFAAQSCIVADPPEYRAPGQTRPVLNMYSAVPTATQALVVISNATTATSFTVQVRSEDAGEPLRAVFFLDYQIKRNLAEGQLGEVALVIKTIPASTYDNVGRIFNYSWLPMGTRGCHFLTLVVAHRNSFLEESDESHLDPRYANDDAALVTWTVNVVDSAADGQTLVDCPSREEPTGQ